MLYVLEGKPVGIVKSRELIKRKQWDDQVELKARLAVSLTTQHDDQPLYEGPIVLQATFYFKFPQYVSREKLAKVSGKPHVSSPAMSELLQFVEWMGRGILFTNDCIIAAIDAKKCYDVTARTEIRIERMG